MKRRENVTKIHRCMNVAFDVTSERRLSFGLPVKKRKMEVDTFQKRATEKSEMK